MVGPRAPSPLPAAMLPVTLLTWARWGPPWAPAWVSPCPTCAVATPPCSPSEQKPAMPKRRPPSTVFTKFEVAHHSKRREPSTLTYGMTCRISGLLNVKYDCGWWHQWRRLSVQRKATRTNVQCIQTVHETRCMPFDVGHCLGSTYKIKQDFKGACSRGAGNARKNPLFRHKTVTVKVYCGLTESR